MRRLTVLVGLNLLAALPVCFGDELEQWEQVQVAKVDGLVVNVRFKKQASLAEEEWLAIEFVNRSNKPIRVESASYRIASERFDLETQELHSSGSLASGNDHDLFPKSADRTVKPGVYRMVDHPSSYSATLLGLAPKNGLLIKAKLHVSLRIENRLTQSDAMFDFQWLQLNDENINQMRKRLKSLLENPRNVVQHAYILHAHLRVAEVARGVNVNELLKAIQPRTESFSGRNCVLDHIDENYAKDPQVIAYFLRRLISSDKRVADDLRRASNVWHPDYLEPLLLLIEGDGGHFPDCFEVLRQRGSPQKDDPQLAKRLSAALIKKGYLDRLHTIRTDDQAVFAGYDLKLLGQTHDSEIVPELIGLLDDKTQTLDPKLLSVPYFRLPPLRVCDQALESILMILDGDPGKGYKAAGLDSFRFSASRDIDAEVKQISELRDKMIETLKQRLKQ